MRTVVSTNFVFWGRNGKTDLCYTLALTFYPLPQERKSPWHVLIFSADRPANPVARVSKDAAQVSPSPP